MWFTGRLTVYPRGWSASGTQFIREIVPVPVSTRAFSSEPVWRSAAKSNRAVAAILNRLAIGARGTRANAQRRASRVPVFKSRRCITWPVFHRELFANRVRHRPQFHRTPAPEASAEDLTMVE